MNRALWGVVACALLGGCSLILDFNDPGGGGGGIDAMPADAGPVGDGGDPCSAYEPNNSLSTAYPIEAGTYSPVGVCPSGDRDFYSFAVDGAQDVVIDALFTNGQGMDLEMRLYNDQGMVIARSETFTDNEEIVQSSATNTLLPAGTYSVEIFGFNNVDANDYQLVLTLTTP